MPGLHDGAGFRLAGGNDGRILRRRDRLRRERAHLLEHAERHVAVVVDGGDHRELRSHVAELDDLVHEGVQTGERRRGERYCAAHQNARLLVVEGEDAWRGQDLDVGLRRQCLEDGAHVHAGKPDDADAEALEARERGVAEVRGPDPDGGVPRGVVGREDLPVDPPLAGAVEGHLGNEHLQQHLGRPDVELLDRFLEQREVGRGRADHERVGGLVGDNRGPAHQAPNFGLGALRHLRRGDHLGGLRPLLEGFNLALPHAAELVREAASLQRLHALPARRPRHGGAE